MKKLIPAVVFFLQLNTCFGQGSKNVLSVGDKMPDVEILNILNYSAAASKISDFKGKLLILDFWATWCSPCVAALPKLESLKSKFVNKLQVLAITQESKEVVSDFYAKLLKVKKIELPASVTDDKKFSKLFFHTIVPHYVWINETGEIIAITGTEDVNEKNITDYFREGKFDYTLKQDNPGMAIGSPMQLTPSILLRKDDGDQIRQLDTSVLTIHSVLTKYVDAIGGGGQFAPSNYVFWGNATIKKLYQTALYDGGFRVLNSSSTGIITDIADSAFYSHITALTPGGKTAIYPNTGDLAWKSWSRENTYCYELKVPPSLVSQKYKIMLDQLNLYFGAELGIEGVLEKKMNKYLALVRTSAEDKIEAKGGEIKIALNSLYIKVENATVQNLVNRLLLPLQLHPVLEDETGYKGRITIELNCPLSDLEALNKELAKYDLQIIEKQKIMEVGIIRKKS